MPLVKQENDGNQSSPYWDQIDKTNAKIETWPAWKKNLRFNGDRVHNDKLIASGLTARRNADWIEHVSLPSRQIRLRSFLSLYLPFRFRRLRDKFYRLADKLAWKIRRRPN